MKARAASLGLEANEDGTLITREILKAAVEANSDAKASKNLLGNGGVIESIFSSPTGELPYSVTLPQMIGQLLSSPCGRGHDGRTSGSSGHTIPVGTPLVAAGSSSHESLFPTSTSLRNPACREVHTCSNKACSSAGMYESGPHPTTQAGVGRRTACGMRAARFQGAEGFLVDMIVTCASTQTNFSSPDR